MAKSKQDTQQQGNGGKKGGNGRGETTDRARAIADSENGRTRNRNLRHAGEQRREDEIAAGKYYSRLNTNRSTVVSDAVNGVLGLYAFPGGDNPSIHVEVASEIIGTGKVAVIKFETAQRGHELEGEAFDSKVYLPAYYVEKFGSNFSPRMGGMAGKTQKLIMSYMLKLLDGYGAPEVDEVTTTVSATEELFTCAKTSEDDIQQMLDGVLGLYGMKTDQGTLIVSAEQVKGKSALCVASSTVPNIVPSRAFLYAHLLERPTLDQVVPDEIYQHQLELFTFIQANKPAKKEEVPLTASGRPMGARERAKLARRKTEVKQASHGLSTAGDIVPHLKKGAITLRDAALGKIGHVVIGHATGETIIKYCQIGADKVVEIVHMDENNLLKIAGCKNGTKVYVGQLMKGEIDQIDRAMHRMTDAEVKAANAFITFLREQLAICGIKLRTQHQLQAA
jgi:hypothetical protein